MRSLGSLRTRGGSHHPSYGQADLSEHCSPAERLRGEMPDLPKQGLPRCQPKRAAQTRGLDYAPVSGLKAQPPRRPFMQPRAGLPVNYGSLVDPVGATGRSFYVWCPVLMPPPCGAPTEI